LNGEKVWPPSWSEIITGYQRIASLMDSNVEAGDPISKVFFVKDFYGPLQSDLQKIANSINARFISFGYDWRKSITESAHNLGELINAQVVAQGEEITLVAHSMGGLVCRYLLESGEFVHQPWFNQIQRLVGLAVPNLGSPLALVRALGLKGSVSLSGSDIIKISSDKRYPSLYQLLPPPNNSILWRVKGANIEPLNHFNTSIVKELGLSEDNMTYT
ncbi:MAG: lipase/acyltransferase domain-containing protein, partial [Microcystis sp.]